jgi:hypothetical protein
MKKLLLLLLITSSHSLFAQSDSLQIQQDTAFSISGDTLLGKITIDKDNNQYRFKSATLDTVLNPTKIKRLVHFSKENNNERQVFDAIFYDFYFLELGENELITLYAKCLYTKVTKNGPTYYTVKKKYCVTKNAILYPLKSESLKKDLLFLISDCADMGKKIRREKIRFENLALFIRAYNHCGNSKK